MVAIQANLQAHIHIQSVNMNREGFPIGVARVWGIPHICRDQAQHENKNTQHESEQASKSQASLEMIPLGTTSYRT